MKLIIDVPEEDYKFIKDLQSLIIGSRGNCKTIQKNVINAIRNGIPYEERPHGKWIFKHNSSDIWCSVCDENFDEIPQKFNYCPECGADMRGEDHD